MAEPVNEEILKGFLLPGETCGMKISKKDFCQPGRAEIKKRPP